MDVTLRVWGDDDGALLAALNTPGMTEHLGGPESDDDLVERHERYLRLNASEEAAMRVVEVDGIAAGSIGFWEAEDDGVPVYEAGWSILPAFQGRGVARTALGAILRLAAERGDRGAVVAYPAIDNAPSNALCRRAGFEERGVGRMPWRGGELTFRTWVLDVSPLDLAGRDADVDERFEGEVLDLERWWPHYTPHWSSRARTAARFDLDGGLTLRIDDDSAPWAPEIDGDIRVSHLQTGQHSGAVGSGVGQHRFRPDLVVREEQPERRLWLPHHGVIEASFAAIRHPRAMVAFWPIGFEAAPDDCGEICIAEIFGSEIGESGGLVGVGVKAQNDPRLRDDFEKVPVSGDLTEVHSYAVEWSADRLRFFVGGRWVKTVAQRLDYPVQLMLDVYEFPDGDEPTVPLRFAVERVRSFSAR